MPVTSEDFDKLREVAHERSQQLIMDHVIAGLRRRDPPKELYHYTSAEGLYGILTKRQFWASEHRHLNDPQDSQYIFSLLTKPHVRAVCNSSLIEKIWDGMGQLSRRGVYDTEARIYVAAFSRSRDDLDQWRSYAADGRGYVICFAPALLETVPDSTFVEVEYDENEQISLLTSLLHMHENLAKDLAKETNLPEPSVQSEVGLALVHTLEMVGPFLKHPAYKHEREWRWYVYTPPLASEDPNMFETRVRGDLVVPYLRLPFHMKGDATRLPLNSVGTGPAHDHSRASSGLSLLLAQLGYYDEPRRKVPRRVQRLVLEDEEDEEYEAPELFPFLWHSDLPYRSASQR